MAAGLMTLIAKLCCLEVGDRATALIPDVGTGAPRYRLGRYVPGNSGQTCYQHPDFTGWHWSGLASVVRPDAAFLKDLGGQRHHSALGVRGSQCEKSRDAATGHRV